MTTKKTEARKWVVKRTNATRDCPDAEPSVLGFVKGRSMTEAAEAATLRFGCADHQLMVLIPVNTATREDIRAGFLAEADSLYGSSFGKRKKARCPCGTVSYYHPRVGESNCLTCGKPVQSLPWVMVDMTREAEAMGV